MSSQNTREKKELIAQLIKLTEYYAVWSSSRLDLTDPHSACFFHSGSRNFAGWDHGVKPVVNKPRPHPRHFDSTTSPNIIMTTSAEFKSQGNAAFVAKDFKKAAELFTEAINAAEPSAQDTHVLYSNRSGAYASLKDYQSALKDAERTVELKNDWAKGYNRLGAAQHGLGQLEEAVASYNKALELDPSNTQAKQGKQSAENALASAGPGSEFDRIFHDPNTLAKLLKNPKTAGYMQDPTFLDALQKMSKDPMSVLSSGQQPDPRLMEALGVIMGGDLDMEGDAKMADPEAKKEPETKPEPKKAKPEPTASTSSSSSSSDPKKAEADAEKQKGNELYKKREFDAAIEHYDRAWESYKDITYLNNRAAAEYEKGDYDAAIKTCLTAVEESHELRSDYKTVAKTLARIGNSYLKQDKLKEAIEYFDKSLTEQRSPDVLNKLRSTQRELRVREEQAYIDPAKAEEAREQGNQEFKEAKFPESVKSYTEAIKRNPKEPKGYANRAASYLKLMSYPDAIRDCDKAIELDPNFLKAYTRKATAYNVMKQYRKSMETLDQARVIDKDHKHSREIEELYQKASTQRFATLPGETEDQRTERLCQDPEIDEIRRDPVMNTILQQAASDPAALRDHMKNPEVSRKINLLAAAGIIRTR